MRTINAYHPHPRSRITHPSIPSFQEALPDPPNRSAGGHGGGLCVHEGTALQGPLPRTLCAVPSARHGAEHRAGVLTTIH